MKQGLSSGICFDSIKTLDNGMRVDGGNLIQVPRDFEGNIHIDDDICEIADGAFSSCDKIENIIFSSKLEQLNGYLFKDCTSLHTLELPDSIRFISGKYFIGSALISVTTPNGRLKTIRNGVYDTVDNTLVALLPFNRIFTLPEFVEDFNTEVFDHLPTIEKVDFSQNTHISSIPSGLFLLCENLQSIKFHNNTRHISSHAFCGCKKLFQLSNMELPNQLETIDAYAFNRIAAKSITLPNSLRYIGESAFSGTKIKDIVIPRGVLAIAYGAFSDCNNLESVNIQGYETVIDNEVFRNCPNLKTVSIPDKYRFSSRRLEDLKNKITQNVEFKFSI